MQKIYGPVCNNLDTSEDGDVDCQPSYPAAACIKGECRIIDLDDCMGRVNFYKVRGGKDLKTVLGNLGKGLSKAELNDLEKLKSPEENHRGWCEKRMRKLIKSNLADEKTLSRLYLDEASHGQTWRSHKRE